MNINNLEIDKKYKWKQLCEAIGVPVSDGSTRKKQIKELESLCKFTKEGVWFTIEEIYETPKPIEDKRSNRDFPNSIDNLMKSAIMYKVVNSEEGCYCGGINNWLLEIGVVNSDFVSYNQKFFRKQYERSTDEDDDLTLMDRDFISLEYSSLRTHFINALEKIKKTKLADYFITCRVGYSENKVVKWTRDLNDDEMKKLYAEKNRLYKKYKILNELDLLYGNEKLGIERDTFMYNEFRKELRKILRKEFNGANFEYTAYKVILKNTSEMALKLIDQTFFKDYNLTFLQTSIYVKRKRCAEKRQEDAQKKYIKVDKEGEFFDRINEMYINRLNLNDIDLLKINGLYVELWDAIWKELMV
jgi:hypothetical protein